MDGNLHRLKGILLQFSSLLFAAARIHEISAAKASIFQLFSFCKFCRIDP
jgi:hypothetical protein